MQQPVRPPPARAKAAPRPPRPPRRRFSRPELRHQVTIQSEHAQRVLRRALRATASALYGLEVVLYALAEDQSAVEQLEEAIDATLAQLAETVTRAAEEYGALLARHEGAPQPQYRHPLRATLVIASPRMMTYAVLLEQYDQLVQVIDRLWFAQAIRNRVHANVVFGLRTAFFDARKTFVRLEEGARRAALRLGHLDEADLASAGAVVEMDDDDGIDSAEDADPALASGDRRSAAD